MKQVMQVDNQQMERIDRSHVSKNILKIHNDHIKRQLRSLGAVRYDLILPETNVLPLVIQPDETILGIVFGKYRQDTPGAPIIGRGALVATDRRVLLIDHKPLFMKCNELSYWSVSGVSYSKLGFAGMVTLYTRFGNINVRTFNQNCAHNFVEAIERNTLQGTEQSYDYVT